MNLRRKLAFAQAPLVVGVLVCGLVGAATISTLGESSDRILHENYRSVLAAQRMKELLAEIDHASLRSPQQVDEAVLAALTARFLVELSAAEGNVTEAGEADALLVLRATFHAYRDELSAWVEGAHVGDGRRYDSRVEHAYRAVRDAIDRLLAMNQDAMVQKSDAAQALARRLELLLGAAAAVTLLVAFVVTSASTARILRPLGVLTQAARRLGEGDLEVRAEVRGTDEIALLASELNAMASHLEAYRRSSLGELIEAQLAAQAAIDSLPDPVFVVRPDGGLTHVNRATTALFAVDLEAGGELTLDTLEAPLRKTLMRAREPVVSGQGPGAAGGLDDAVLLDTREGERHFLVHAMPVYAPQGAVVGVTLVLQDVSRLLRIDELRNDLVATVAHELRTPLTSLHMAVHLCLEGAAGVLPEKATELLFAGREDCERLQAFVDELLDLSRIQAGRLELRRAPVEVDALLRAALEGQRTAAAEHSVALRSEALPGLLVDADAERVELVLANLLENALRYSPPGGTVTARALAEGDLTRVEIDDDGPGVPAGQEAAIFAKYYQAPGEKQGGAGLGLYLAREVVEAHGGTIGVFRRPEGGARFWFTLPTSAEERAS